LATRVQAERGASNNKQQHRPKIFVIAFFLYASAAVSSSGHHEFEKQPRDCETGDRHGKWFNIDRNSEEVRYIYSQTLNQ
jgi:hypothetical protein